MCKTELTFLQHKFQQQKEKKMQLLFFSFFQRINVLHLVMIVIRNFVLIQESLITVLTEFL